MNMRIGVLMISAILILTMAGMVNAAVCTDSDNGVNYYAKGQVIISENETSLSYNDACVYKLEETNEQFYVNLNGVLYNNKAECSGDNCYIAEAFCENNAKKWTVKTCLNGCLNGACVCPITKCSDGTVYGPEKCNVKDNTCVCPSCPATRPVTCSAMPTCTGAKDTGQKDSDGCPIYSCQATPVCPSTKCNDGGVYECKIIDNQCSCPTCPAVKPIELRCLDYDNGLDYYEKGLIKWMVSDGSWNQNYDSCVDNNNLYEGSCDFSEVYLDGKKAYKVTSFICPNGCSDGACIKGEQVTEKITCKFQDTQNEQKCYIAGGFSDADLNTKYCIAPAGLSSCVITYTGYKGEKVTWKSSCGQYQYTTQDGNDEVIYFKCSEGKTNITQVLNKGFRNVYFECYDGAESKSTDRAACKSTDYWKKFATNFCENHCDKKSGKCGINSFSIGEECYLEERVICGVGNLPPCESETVVIQAQCEIDSDCPQPKCGETEKCAGVSVKCSEGKCIYGSATEPMLICKDSCPLDGKCYPFGYRKSGNFCSDSGGFVAQSEGNKVCDNNFECSSNVCVSGKCVSEGFIQKIMNWFSKLFGSEE